MGRVSVAVVVACLYAILSGTSPTGAAAPATMTRAAIEEAIAAGASGRPAPYLLRHVGADDNPVVVAAVYTPFLRVAFLSHAAAQRGERLEPGDVPRTLIEPHAYLAFRWYCCDPPDAFQLAGITPQVLMLPNPGRSVSELGRDVTPFKMVRTGVRPVWLTEGSGLLRTFGAEPPFDDITLVAAYPLTTLTALRTFVVYKWLVVREESDELSMPQEASFRYGIIRPADAAGWR